MKGKGIWFFALGLAFLVMACGEEPSNSPGGNPTQAPVDKLDYQALFLTTTIKSGPPLDSNTTTATFKFSCGKGKKCAYKCSLDSSAWKKCKSPKTYTKLAEGDHVFQVQARTRSGKSSLPASYSWTVFIPWGQVVAGSGHSCGILTDHTLWCWGANADGQIGDGTTANGFSPIQVGADTNWAQVAGGDSYSCATKTDHTLWCWGGNAKGQLGDGTSVSLPAPAQVGVGTNWGQVSAGADYTCAGKNNGTVWCWGDNWSGQLGLGKKAGRTIYSPAQVGGETNWGQVSAGADHTCATKTDSSLWCWGDNGSGQLGLGKRAGRTIYSPAQVGGETNWGQVSAGADHTCATKTDNSLWCWGKNWSGQLGLGRKAGRKIYSPTQVGGETNWGKVSAGTDYTCATKTDNSLWCWGANASGQLGDGTSVNRYSPTQVGAGTNWGKVSAGTDHTCASKNNGTVWCWGDNASGQLGDGTSVNWSSPTQVIIK